MRTPSNSESTEKQAQIQTPEPPLNPLLESAGKFADDPFWDEMLASIRQHRREMDAEWDTAE